MAEKRQEGIRGRITNFEEGLGYPNQSSLKQQKELLKKGLPTLGWMAGLALPGAGITDVAGLYPEDMSGSGVMMPSMGRNIADKNYLDALYQGMGLFGDAAYASIPVTGPMGVLAGTTLKAGSAMGKAGRGAKVKPIFHGTNKEFDEFDINFSADGSIWFTDDYAKAAQGYEGASGKGIVIERLIDENKLKLATREDIDNFMIPELINKGFDGAKFDDVGGNEVVYQIWNPEKLKGLSSEKLKGVAALPESEDYITAYHGSGADFDEFDIGKIGTGEGVQAFGHGLYFAEAEKVGKYYKDVLGTVIEYDGKPIWKGTERVGTTGDEAADAVIARQYRLTESNDPKDWMDYLDDEMQNNMDYGSAEQYQASLDRYLNLRPLVDKIKIKDTGKLYKTNLKVKPDELLDLDKRLMNQSKVIKKKLSSVLDMKLSDLNPKMYDPPGTVGVDPDFPVTLREMIYERIKDGSTFHETIFQMPGHEVKSVLSAILGPENTSKVLNSAGIKGNKYKDEFSRGKDGGTSNFVIFDDRVIDISKKYGISIPMAGAMLMAEDYKNTVEAEEFSGGGLADVDAGKEIYGGVPITVFENGEVQEIILPSKVSEETKDLYETLYYESWQLALEDDFYYSPDKAFPLIVNEAFENYEIDTETYRTLNALHRLHLKKEKDQKEWTSSEKNPQVRKRKFPWLNTDPKALKLNQGGEVENDVSAYLRFYQYAKDAGLQFPEAVAAQASLESGHGKSDLAIYQNNVLGIKPDDGSQASESYDTLEYINGEPVVINDLFRTFDSQEDSFAGYKDKIDKPRYEKAKGSGTPEDYLMAIDEAGYATDPNYAEKTIDIMNRYSSYL